MAPRAVLVVVWIALSTDLLVYGIAVPVLPRLTAVTDAGPSTAGLLFACYAAALIVVTPLVGWWVDRFGPRQALLAGLVGLGATTAVFSIGGPLSLLVAARLTQGAAAALSWVAGLALIAAVTPLAQRGRNMGLVLSGASIGTLLGPPVGGLLADQFGTAAPFLSAAVVAVGDGILRLLLIRPISASGDDPGTLRAVLGVRGALPATGIVVLGAGVLAVLEPVLPLRLAASGMSSSVIGVIFAAAVLAAAIVTPWAGSLVTTTGPRTPVLAGVLLSAVALLLLAHVRSTGVCVIAMVALGAGSALLLGPILPLLTDLGERATPPALGAVFALVNLAYATGLLLGPGSSGPLTSATGYSTAITLTAAAILITGVPAAARLPRATGLTTAALNRSDAEHGI
jgi:MFS family permease